DDEQFNQSERARNLPAQICLLTHNLLLIVHVLRFGRAKTPERFKEFMTKKNWWMTIALAALAGIYVVYFTDWFRSKTIHISHTTRALRPRYANSASGNSGMVPITFGVEPQCRLTEIKVVPLAAWQTNPNTLPLWHLVYSSNAAPVKMFFYGQRLGGLKPQVPGAHAAPLETNVTYRLFVTAGKARGQHDFEIKPAK
ncbi:MAG TPA: hypothetical protein VNM37_00085, partial [Candidatus Dormibacteraeota bacterium]|nr:hypothetical protein [Candidatus Dormibacteraeota bacterium]